jgi:hypothetical protein
MAYSEAPVLISVKAATTFTSTSLYRPAYWATSGGVSVGDPGSTSIAAKPAGIAYSYTKTTTTDAEPIQLAVSGVVKVKCAATTVTVGELLGFSSNGWGCTPTTNHFVIGRVLAGSSGGAGHVKTVLMFVPPVVYSRTAAGVGTT